MLTEKDYDDLIDALENWRNKDMPAQLMGDLLESLIPPGMPEHLASKFKNERVAEHRKRANESKVRRERAIILMSKLIQMRDESSVNQLLETSSAPSVVKKEV